MQAFEALERFLLSLSGSQSPATQIWYKHRLGSLAAFLGPVRIEDVSTHDLRQWRAALAGRETRYEDHPLHGVESGGLSVYTVHGFVRAARRWFAWLQDEGLVTVNVAERLELPRLPKRPRTGISQSDVDKMLIAATDSCPRDLAIVWFLYSTACRVGGLVKLRMADLDLRNGRAVVTEKMSKSRLVYLVPPAVEAMAGWLAQRPLVAHDFVFTGLRSPSKPLTTNGVYQALKRLARSACVESKWNPHQWRHGVARKLQAEGMPTGVLSQVLGHDGVDVTVAFYGTCTDDELQAAHARYFQLPLLKADGDSA